jgi:HEAT repeat protein
LVLLANVGEHIADALPAIANCLVDSDEEVRLKAVSALRDVGPPGKLVLRELIEMLRDPDWRIRLRTAIAIRSIGPEAESAKPALLLSLNDPDDEVRFFAARALVETAPADVQSIPILVSHLCRFGKDRAVAAAVSLARLGELALSSAPGIMEAFMQDDDPERRRILMDCLMSIMRRSLGDAPIGGQGLGLPPQSVGSPAMFSEA